MESHNFISVCRAKIMGAVVTEVRHRYWASLEVDKKILDSAGMKNFEKVLVVNMVNGKRFETYLVEAPEGEGDIVLAGGGAFLGEVGDDLGLAVFSSIPINEADKHFPKVVILGEGNHIDEVFLEKVGLHRPKEGS